MDLRASTIFLTYLRAGPRSRKGIALSSPRNYDARDALRDARLCSRARFFSSLEEAGARDETIRFDWASLRLGVGRPFFEDASEVLDIGQL